MKMVRVELRMVKTSKVGEVNKSRMKKMKISLMMTKKMIRRKSNKTLIFRSIASTQSSKEQLRSWMNSSKNTLNST